MSGLLGKGSLYILLAGLLAGSFWRGAYFPTSPQEFSFPDSLLAPRWFFVSLLLLAGLWELAAQVAERRRALLASPLLWLFTGLTLYSGLTYFWSEDPAITLRELLLLTAYLAVLVVVGGQRRRFPGETAARISWWLVYTASFIAAWGVVTYILRLSPYANEVDGIYRAGGTFEYSNALGCFSLMAIPFATALMGKMTREDRVLLASGLTLMTAAVILSLSRATLVLFLLLAVYLLIADRGSMRFVLLLTSFGFGMGMAVASMLAAEAGMGAAGIVFPVLILPLAYYTQSYLIARGREKALRIAYAAAGIAMVAAAAGAALTARARNIIYERFGEGFAWSRLLPHREDTWKGALDAFRERPVRGWGLGLFARVYEDFAITSFTKYAHNLVLHAAIEGGIIGAALMALFLLYVVAVSLLRVFRATGPLCRAAAAAALVFIAFNLFDWEWFVPALTAWFMVAASLAEGSVEPPGGGAATDEDRIS